MKAVVLTLVCLVITPTISLAQRAGYKPNYSRSYGQKGGGSFYQGGHSYTPNYSYGYSQWGGSQNYPTYGTNRTPYQQPSRWSTPKFAPSKPWPNNYPGSSSNWLGATSSNRK